MRICSHFPLILRHFPGSKISVCPLPCSKSPENKYLLDNDGQDDFHEVLDDPDDDEDLGRGDVVKSVHPFVPAEVFLQPACAGNLLGEVKNR